VLLNKHIKINKYPRRGPLSGFFQQGNEHASSINTFFPVGKLPLSRTAVQMNDRIKENSFSQNRIYIRWD